MIFVPDIRVRKYIKYDDDGDYDFPDARCDCEDDFPNEVSEYKKDDIFDERLQVLRSKNFFDDPMVFLLKQLTNCDDHEYELPEMRDYCDDICSDEVDDSNKSDGH